MATRSSVKKLETITLVWPITYTNNRRNDAYVPLYERKSNIDIKNNILSNNGPFPWNTDQNMKSPLANGLQLNTNTTTELFTESGFASNTTNPDEDFEGDYEEIIVA